MKRECVHYRSSVINDKHIYIDAEIGDFLFEMLIGEDMESIKFAKKFDYIVNRILEQRNIYYDGYERIKNTKGLSEMRIFPNGENIRIYCKEINSNDGILYVVAAKYLPKKKSNTIDKKLWDFIKPIEDYDYDI